MQESLLLREHKLRGCIDLAAFYTRRAGRILPAATVVILTTLAASAFVVAPLDRGTVAIDGAAAALFVGNLRFAARAADYFASTTPSPFQHFWSLGVEEQFYLLWPLLLIVGLRLGRSRVPLIIGAFLLLSLTLSLLRSPVDAVSSFYGLHTRAWQLALGALLAVHAPQLVCVPRQLTLAGGPRHSGAGDRALGRHRRSHDRRPRHHRVDGALALARGACDVNPCARNAASTGRTASGRSIETPAKTRGT